MDKLDIDENTRIRLQERMHFARYISDIASAARDELSVIMADEELTSDTIRRTLASCVVAEIDRFIRGVGAIANYTDRDRYQQCTELSNEFTRAMDILLDIPAK